MRHNTKPTPAESGDMRIVCCPNCHTSVMLCPCRLVPHGATGLRMLDPARYLDWRTAQFEKCFGISYAKARAHPLQPPALRRALRELDTARREAEKWRNARAGVEAS